MINLNKKYDELINKIKSAINMTFFDFHGLFLIEKVMETEKSNIPNTIMCANLHWKITTIIDFYKDLNLLGKTMDREMPEDLELLSTRLLDTFDVETILTMINDTEKSGNVVFLFMEILIEVRKMTELEVNCLVKRALELEVICLIKRALEIKYNSTKINKVLENEKNLKTKNSPKIDWDEYLKVRQNSATNELCATITKDISKFRVNAIGSGKYIKNDFELNIENIEGITRSTTAVMLYMALMIELTNTSKRNITISLNDYAELRGSNKKNVKNQVIRDVIAISTLSISYRNNTAEKITIRGAKVAEEITFNTRTGVITCDFSEMYFKSLSSQFMYISKNIFKIDTKLRPHAFYMGIKLSACLRMNKKTIGVNSLIKSCPNFPQYDDLNDSKQFTQLMLKPFRNNLDSINGLTWRFSGKNGIEVKEPTTYKSFIRANIVFAFENYPDIDHIFTKKNEIKSKIENEAIKIQAKKATSK